MRYFIEILKCRLKLLFLNGYDLIHIETIMYGYSNGWHPDKPRSESLKEFKAVTLKQVLENMHKPPYSSDGIKYTKMGLYCRKFGRYKGLEYTVVIRVDKTEGYEKN